MKIQRTMYKGFRLIASAIIILFMFVEELILKPLRTFKILILEKTIKRMNGYWTIGTLVALKTIEGLCKVALLFSPNAYWVMFIVFMDGFLGFISMNIIIHGHENLKDFHWYHRVVRWIVKIKEEIKATATYKWAHRIVVDVREWVKELWRNIVFKIFGKKNPKGLWRYIKTAVRLSLSKRRQA